MDFASVISGKGIKLLILHMFAKLTQSKQQTFKIGSVVTNNLESGFSIRVMGFSLSVALHDNLITFHGLTGTIYLECSYKRLAIRK